MEVLIRNNVNLEKRVERSVELGWPEKASTDCTHLWYEIFTDLGMKH